MNDPFSEYEGRKAAIDSAYDAGYISDYSYSRECDKARDEYVRREYLED